MERITIYPAAVALLAKEPGVKAEIKRVGDVVADRARILAPKDTGAGARSIRAEVEGDEVHVSWDSDHEYMIFPEYGTKYQKAQPFLRPAVMTPLSSSNTTP